MDLADVQVVKEDQGRVRMLESDGLGFTSQACPFPAVRFSAFFHKTSFFTSELATGGS